ncbi:MAG: GNAT family N-acetyltransferase [Sporolactobacillus sp.]
MEICPATANQAGDLGYVQAMSWRAAYADIIPKHVLSQFTPDARSRAFSAACLTQPPYHYLGYVEGSPAAFLAVGPSRDVDSAPHTAEVAALYLLPDYWGHGYGRELMDFAVNLCRTCHCTAITLWVLEKNSRAIHFYTHYGFVFDGRARLITLGVPLDERRLRLKLVNVAGK